MYTGALSTKFGGTSLHSNRLLTQKGSLLPIESNPHTSGTQGLPPTALPFTLPLRTNTLLRSKTDYSLTSCDRVTLCLGLARLQRKRHSNAQLLGETAVPRAEAEEILQEDRFRPESIKESEHQNK